MRLADRLMMISAMVHAVSSDTHEMTPEGWVQLDEELLRCVDDAYAIELRMRQPDAAAIVASLPALHLEDYVPPVDTFPAAEPDAPSNVVQFPLWAQQRLSQQPEAQDTLQGLHAEICAHAREGELAPDDGGSAA